MPRSTQSPFGKTCQVVYGGCVRQAVSKISIAIDRADLAYGQKICS